MKNRISLLPILLILLSLNSCIKKDNYKIGFLAPSGEGTRWVADQKFVEEQAQKSGIIVYSRSADNNEDLQLSQASELLESGIDVLIIVAVNSNTAAAIVREAHEYNVPVIAYDNLIKNCDLDYYVAFESSKIGSMMIDHALRKKPKGNYILLWGDPGDLNALDIRKAQEEKLHDYVVNGDINIVYKCFIDDWSTSNAYQKMNKILSFSDKKIDAVITSYDGLAMGVLQSFDDMGIDRKDIVITGQDGEIEALQAIVNDDMSFTIFIPIKKIAYEAVDLAVKIAKRDKLPEFETKIFNGRKDVPTVYLEGIPIDKTTINEKIISAGYYSDQQIYGRSN